MIIIEKNSKFKHKDPCDHTIEVRT